MVPVEDRAIGFLLLEGHCSGVANIQSYKALYVYFMDGY